MEPTLFLASIWGPVILAVAVGIFTSRKYYVKIYRDLEKDSLAMLVFGMVAMTAGLIHVQIHSVWDTLPQILVSLLGWGILLKGAAFLVAPRFVDASGDWAANANLVNVAGGIALIMGGYLSWLAYFA
jgi:hypothetical protein